jgi:hypothetical protein
MCTAPAAAELFDYCPLFDEVVTAPWDGNGADFCGRIFRDRRPLPSSDIRPAFYLGPGEPEYRGYIAVHPFAGTANRDWRGKVEIEGALRAITAIGPTVLLGGSSERTEGRGTVRRVRLDEMSDLEMPGLMNLVGRASVRVQAFAAANAAAFAGSFSAYHCAAFPCGVPAFLVAPRELESFFRVDHPVYGVVANRARVAYFDEDLSCLIDSLRQCLRRRTAT